MARRASPPGPSEPPLELRVLRSEANTKLSERIKLGNELLEKLRQGRDAVAFKTEVLSWSKYNEELLRRLFTNESLAKEFQISGFAGRIAHSEQDVLRIFIETFPRRLECLESIRERLELFNEPPQLITDSNAAAQEISAASASKVFVVHGHNEAILHAVCQFIEKLGLEAIVLSEKANEGRTIIEKIEAHSDVGFAVVLFTGDDLGCVKTDPDKLSPRARQNVVLELGYFIGHLGRKRVCPIYEGGVELPSDYLGVGFVSLDSGGDWMIKLAREMKAAGLNFDLNRVI